MKDEPESEEDATFWLGFILHPSTFILSVMPLLSVNVNKIALLRNAREGKGPDVVHLARRALQAGAHGITIHPRPDERHIRYADARPLANLVARFDGAEFNIEGNPFEGRWMELVQTIRPQQATLVPDDPNQNTSDHGFAMPGDIERLRPIIAELKEVGCRVSVFMDPNPEQVARVVETGADRVELYTESFAEAHARRRSAVDLYERTRSAFSQSAKAAANAGLGVNAGHDLNRRNLHDFVKSVAPITEVSIGHALIGDALEYGLAGAVNLYRTILGNHRSRSSHLV